MDDELIAASRRRITNGHGNKIDHWRMRVAERQAQREATVTKDISDLDVVRKVNVDAMVQQETMGLEESARWIEWAQNCARGVVEEYAREVDETVFGAILKVTDGLERRIDELQREVKELRKKRRRV
jgi:hypothetical protein